MNKFFTLMTLLAVSLAMNAQDNAAPGNMKFDIVGHRMQQHKYMAEMAEMTPEDSVRFFAVYDEMRKKEYELYGDNHKIRHKRPETDKECRDAMMHADSIQLKAKQLQLEYHSRLLDVVSPKKALRAIIAGEEFDRMAFRNMNRPMDDGKRVDPGHKNGRGGKNPRRPRHEGPRTEMPDSPMGPPMQEN